MSNEENKEVTPSRASRQRVRDLPPVTEEKAQAVAEAASAAAEEIIEEMAPKPKARVTEEKVAAATEAAVKAIVNELKPPTLLPNHVIEFSQPTAAWRSAIQIDDQVETRQGLRGKVTGKSHHDVQVQYEDGSKAAISYAQVLKVFR